MSELERLVKLDRVPTTPLRIDANEAERTALARRFALPAIHSLSAEIQLATKGQEISASGHLTTDFEQTCAVSGDPFRNRVSEPVALRFVPEYSHSDAAPDAEIELSEEDLDEIVYHGQAFDLGEAVAQSFGLAIDPYAQGPQADTAREEAGLNDPDATGPFAALAALIKN